MPEHPDQSSEPLAEDASALTHEVDEQHAVAESINDPDETDSGETDSTGEAPLDSAADAADGSVEADADEASDSATSESEASPELAAASAPYIGRWNMLVSTTNWEKGHIIYEWREALVAAEAPTTEYSDEAWARRVGGVTGQHVGRLRRVYHRFGKTHKQYSGLYWSHFQAALEWNDAEMWLEGAVQSKWSVSQMRKQRWEAIGGPDDKRPSDEDIISTEVDEDYQGVAERQVPQVSGSVEEAQGPRHEGPDFGDEDDAAASSDFQGEPADAGLEPTEPAEYVKPFENLGDLPDDMAEAFEMFKLAILRHKGEDWQEISRDEVLASLDALKQLAVAPGA